MTKICNKCLLFLQPITKSLSFYLNWIDRLEECCLWDPPFLIGMGGAYPFLQREPPTLTRSRTLKTPTGRGAFQHYKTTTLGADEVCTWVGYILYVPGHPLRRPHVDPWYMVCTVQNDTGEVWWRLVVTAVKCKVTVLKFVHIWLPGLMLFCGPTS